MKISEVQKFIKDRLVADEFVQASGATVVIADDGDSEYEVQRSLAEIGLAVIVTAPKWKPTSTSAKSAVGMLTVNANVTECPGINRAVSSVHGIDLAEHIAVLLNLERPFPNSDILVLDDAGIDSAAVENPQTKHAESVVWFVPFKMIHQLSD